MRTYSRLLLAVLALVAAPVSAMQFTSTLSSLRVQARPGEVADRFFELHLVDGQAAARFAMKIEDWWSSEDGSQSFYRPAGALPRSCGAWAMPTPALTTVGGGGTLRVRVRVAVPRTARPGGYWCVLTLDEVADPRLAPPGVAVQFLSSVTVGVFVYVGPLERAATIEEVTIDGPTLSVLVANAGNTPLAVEGRVEFLPRPGGTPVAVVALPRSTLLLDPQPRRRVRVRLPDAAHLPPGRYLVRVLLDIGLDHYLGVQKDVDLAAGTGR